MGTEQTFTYYTEHKYGTEHKYAVSDNAEMISALTGTVTLADWAIATVKHYYPQARFEEVLKPRF